MWFTRTGDDRIGRITTTGELTAFELAEGSGPFGITAGAGRRAVVHRHDIG